MFPRGVALRNADQLLFVSARADGSPLGLRLAAEDLGILRRSVRVGAEFAVVGLELHGAGLRLSLHPGGGYDCRQAPAPPSYHRCCRWLSRARAERRRTGLATSVSSIEEALPVGWSDAISGNSRSEAELALRVVLGRGPGLTPSGDDVLLGMLLVDTLRPFLTTAREVLEGLLDEELTTLVSRCYLRAGLRARFGGALRAVARFLTEQSSDSLDGVWVRLADYGHSSGLDTAAGVVAALRILGMSPSVGGADRREYED